MAIDYSHVRRPLEVFALDDNLDRATGSIPYTSLMWSRRYTEPGEFSMDVPSNVYATNWSYIYCDERPEMGIVQKVEFSDTSHTPSGVDTVTVSGFFLEAMLNNFIFLDESPEKQVIETEPPKKVSFLLSHLPDVYVDPVGGYYYTNESGDVVSADSGNVLASTEGLTKVEYDVCGRNPGWLTGAETGTRELTDSFYYKHNGQDEKIHWIFGPGEGQDREYDIEFVDDRGNYFYRTETGKLHQACGVVETPPELTPVYYPYAAKIRDWASNVDGRRYKTVYVKGPWQRTDLMEPITEGDSVEMVMRWAQRFAGDNIIYVQPGFEGITKMVDPSFQYLGDLLYSTFNEVGASFRLEYSFLDSVICLIPYKGLDRTQEQGEKTIIVEDPNVPDGFTELEYIQGTGSQYIDTYVNASSSLTMKVKLMANEEVDYSLVGTYTASNQHSYRLFNHQGVCYWDCGDATEGSGRIFGGSMPAGQVFEVECGNLYVKDLVSGQTIISGASVSAFTHNESICVFGNTNFSKARVYYLKIFDGGQLVRDMLPCRRDSDGAVGMYDLIGGNFYGNSGTGTIVAGPEAEIPTHEETVYGNPWAVFSDTWGTIYDYSASNDTSNYRNTCHVLYDYDKPDAFDDTGWPVADFIMRTGDLLALPTGYGISYTRCAGYNTERLAEGKEPDIETYIDLRDEKPECDGDWSRDVVDLPGKSGDEREQAIESAMKKFARPEGNTDDLGKMYEDYEASLQGRGITYLKENYSTVTNLDTGVVDTYGYMRDWDLGDLVEMEVSTVGLVRQARIIAVDEVYDSKSTKISIEIGEEKLDTIKKAVLTAGGR